MEYRDMLSRFRATAKAAGWNDAKQVETLLSIMHTMQEDAGLDCDLCLGMAVDMAKLDKREPV